MTTPPPPTPDHSTADRLAEATALHAEVEAEWTQFCADCPKYAVDPHPSSVEVARLLRADLKAAQASAALPPSAVFSVRSEAFAGGQAVRVEIRNLSDREILDDHPDYPRRLNRAARELERTVRRMANAHDWDASDRASDVYDVHYQAHVSIETERGRRTRQRMDAEEMRRASRPRTIVERAKNARPC